MALEPTDWNALDGWAMDDHAAAFATFLTSCRPLLRTIPPKAEMRPMYFALTHVCRQAVAVGQLAAEQARTFFERNFRPLRITKLGDGAGFLTGYYEPIVDGSRFPTGIFKVPIYRRPRDLVPPLNSTGSGFPNRGQSLRRTPNGDLVPYYDRGEILDGALDGQHLEICWIKDPTDHCDLDPGLGARAPGRRNNVAHHLRCPQRIPIRSGRPHSHRTKTHPARGDAVERIRDGCALIHKREEVRRQNRSFVFFRITGLSDEGEAVGAQGVPLTPGRSIAVDNSTHVYGTPFFIQTGLPVTNERRHASFDRLMIAQDTGSAIVGPARADIYWGAGDQAGHIAGRLRHPGKFAMLVPRELDPLAAGERTPLPPERPPPPAKSSVRRYRRKRRIPLTFLVFTADCRLRHVTRDFVKQFHATPSSVGKDEMNTRLSGKNFEQV